VGTIYSLLRAVNFLVELAGEQVEAVGAVAWYRKTGGDDSARLDAVNENLARCDAVIVPVNTLNESGCPFAN